MLLDELGFVGFGGDRPDRWEWRKNMGRPGTSFIYTLCTAHDTIHIITGVCVFVPMSLNSKFDFNNSQVQ